MASDEGLEIGRRDFLRAGAAGLGGMAAAGLPQPGTAQTRAGMIDYKAPPLETVRIGLVGVGGMGTAHVRNLLRIPGVEIRAACDIVEQRVERAQEMVVKAGSGRPEGYSRGPWDFKRLCDREDLDLVFTATPWEWHVPICLAAMESGKHAATEVPAAVT
ncbi:MAG: twin-arginine translocation signal domain-containing protein, partial [Acidobacteria bacterium]|nr:twin-arginine translocation signal domain-containing protein [Acidobacteriota bacterium]